MKATKEEAEKARQNFAEFCDHVNANAEHQGVIQIGEFLNAAKRALPSESQTLTDPIDEDEVERLFDSLSTNGQSVLRAVAQETIDDPGLDVSCPPSGIFACLTAAQWCELLRYQLAKMPRITQYCGGCGHQYFHRPKVMTRDEAARDRSECQYCREDDRADRV